MYNFSYKYLFTMLKDEYYLILAIHLYSGKCMYVSRIRYSLQDE